MMNDDKNPQTEYLGTNIPAFDTEGYKVEKPDLGMFDDLPDFDVNKKLFDVELDTSGANCPIPIIKAKKELKMMKIGERLKLISTDPGAVADIQSLCNALKQGLEKTIEEDNRFIFVICKTTEI